jgi:hypothetical protein
MRITTPTFYGFVLFPSNQKLSKLNRKFCFVNLDSGWIMDGGWLDKDFEVSLRDSCRIFQISD